MFAVFAVPVPLLLRHGGNWDHGDYIEYSTLFEAQKSTLRCLPPLNESMLFLPNTWKFINVFAGCYSQIFYIALYITFIMQFACS